MLTGTWPRHRWECATIALSAIHITCTSVEIAKYIGEALTPWIMVFTHVTKLCCAGGALGLSVVVRVKDIDKLFSDMGLALAGVLL